MGVGMRSLVVLVSWDFFPAFPFLILIFQRGKKTNTYRHMNIKLRYLIPRPLWQGRSSGVIELGELLRSPCQIYKITWRMEHFSTGWSRAG